MDIFIQIKPARWADVVIDALKNQGYKVTGTGGFVGEHYEGVRDVWVEPPNGHHPDEFGIVIPKN